MPHPRVSPRALVARGRAPVTTFGAAFDGRRNAFTLTRWLLAVGVIVSHTFAVTGWHDFKDPFATLARYQTDLGQLAVCGFFVLSGFLVAKSFEHSPNALIFLWRRALRVLPAFWLSLILVAFVIAPLLWTHDGHSLSSYWSLRPSPWHYVTTNAWVTINQWSIGPVLQHSGFAASGHLPALNGSLWTLIYEVKCYVVLAALGALGLLRYRRVIVGLVGILFAVQMAHVVAPTYATKLLPAFFDNSVAFLPFTFFVGVAAYLYRNELVHRDAYAVTAALVTTWSLHYQGFATIGLLAFAYLVLWFVLRVDASWFDRRVGDPSYGTYVYAFPLHVLLADYGLRAYHAHPFAHALVVTIVAAVAAATVAGWLSWWLFEKHLQRFKNPRWLVRGSRRAF